MKIIRISELSNKHIDCDKLSGRVFVNASKRTLWLADEIRQRDFEKERSFFASNPELIPDAPFAERIKSRKLY